MLPCEVRGEPKPSIIWQNPNYEAIEFDSNKYEIVNDTNLKINFLHQKDHGIYRCYAHNEFSNNYLRKKFGSIFLNIDCKVKIVYR